MAHAIRSRFFAAKAVGAREKIQVLTDRQLPIERKLLRHVAQMLPGRGAGLAHIDSRNRQGASRGGQEPAEHAERCGFAGSVRSEQTENLPSLDAETHMVNRDKFPETPIEIVDFDHGVAPGAIGEQVFPGGSLRHGSDWLLLVPPLAKAP
jgi:hypothetical protein